MLLLPAAPLLCRFAIVTGALERLDRGEFRVVRERAVARGVRRVAIGIRRAGVVAVFDVQARREEAGRETNVVRRVRMQHTRHRGLDRLQCRGAAGIVQQPGGLVGVTDVLPCRSRVQPGLGARFFAARHGVATSHAEHRRDRQGGA